MRALEQRAAASAYKTTAVLLISAALAFAFIADNVLAGASCIVIYVAGSIPYLVILIRGGHHRWWLEELNATMKRRRRAILGIMIGAVIGGGVYFAMWYLLWREPLESAIRHAIVWLALWSGLQYWLMFRSRWARAAGSEADESPGDAE